MGKSSDHKSCAWVGIADKVQTLAQTTHHRAWLGRLMGSVHASVMATGGR